MSKTVNIIDLIIDNQRYRLINKPEHAYKFVNEISRLKGIQFSLDMDSERINEIYNENFRIQYRVRHRTVSNISFKTEYANNIHIIDSDNNVYKLGDFITKIRLLGGIQGDDDKIFNNFDVYEFKDTTKYNYIAILR